MEPAPRAATPTPASSTTALDPQTVPTADPRPTTLRRASSLVLVHTGTGKGKSTAAFGVVLRAVGHDWPVAVVQFVKSGKWKTGEERAARRLGVDWWKLGEGFTWDSDDLNVDEAKARAAWDHARQLIRAGDHRLVVLDEITYPINWGWLDEDDVTTTIRDRPDHVSVILTGRNAPAGVLDVADTASESVELKHAYRSGVRAKKGIDY